jgi:hypothetical protein
VLKRRWAGSGHIHVPVTPLAQRRDDRIEVLTGRREVVLVALRSLLIEPSFEDTLLDKLLQSGGEDVPRRSGVSLNLIKAVAPEECLPDHQQRPALAHDVEGSRH